MKHFNHFKIFVFITCLTSLAACKTTRTSEKAVSESETAAVTAFRLTFYRSLNTIFRQWNLSADSISLIFQGAESPEFPTAFPSRIEGWSETPSDSLLNDCPSSPQPARDASRPVQPAVTAQIQSPSLAPKSLTIYGLHLAASSKEKSASTTDLKDSVAVATQSQKFKSAVKQPAAPSAPFRWLPVIILITVCICFALILIRYIHKHIFLT